jgi:hypothetical protein
MAWAPCGCGKESFPTKEAAMVLVHHLRLGRTKCRVRLRAASGCLEPFRCPAARPGEARWHVGHAPGSGRMIASFRRKEAS